MAVLQLVPLLLGLIGLANGTFATQRKTTQLDISHQHRNDTIRVTFGSCFNIFNMTSSKPDLWIWLGDAAYTDWTELSGLLVVEDNSLSEEYAWDRFLKTYNDPGYTRLREKVPIIGVWDDHDFGLNDGGSDFKRKEAYRQMFLKFMDTESDSPLRTETSQGIYSDYLIERDGITVHVILLDMRFNFDRETNTRLDADQLAWLEKILIKNSHANVTLIGSSIQVIPDYYRVSETFAYKNKRLLFDLLNKYMKSNVLILSGDVHYAQFYSSQSDSKAKLYRELIQLNLASDKQIPFPPFAQGHFLTQCVFSTTAASLSALSIILQCLIYSGSCQKANYRPEFAIKSIVPSVSWSNSSKCKGFVGGYKLWEFTSSGLSHTQADFQIGATPEMELLTHPFWTESEIKILPNFGQVDIDLLTDNSIGLHLTAFGIHGEILLQTTLNTKQMQFNENWLKQNAKMCQITHERHQRILHLAQFMQHLVGFKNLMTLMYLQVLPLGMVVLPITFGVYIFRKLCQRLLKIC